LWVDTCTLWSRWMVNIGLRILFVPGVIHPSVPAWSQAEFLRASFLDKKDGGRAISSGGWQAGTYVPVVDPDQQWATAGENSSRHRVRNNLPGTPAFSPMVFRTKTLNEFVAMDLAHKARAVIAAVPRDLLARPAAFLLLKDSKSSYAIEGEHPPHDRIQRWGRAIGEAGRRPIDLEELLRSQAIVTGDARFVQLGLRNEGGFVGEHDRDSRLPLPEHIGARPEDLPSLIDGMTGYDRRGAQSLDGVIAAVVLAFGQTRSSKPTSRRFKVFLKRKRKQTCASRPCPGRASSRKARRDDSFRQRSGAQLTPKNHYFNSAGSVVKVCAMGMRTPNAPIWAPAGASNSMVPRMFAVAGYLSVTNVNARCPLAAKGIMSVAICVPVSSRTTTGIFTACVETLLIATPVAVPAVLSKARRYAVAFRLSIGTTASWPLGL
jgi:hypothetical protein